MYHAYSIRHLEKHSNKTHISGGFIGQTMQRSNLNPPSVMIQAQPGLGLDKAQFVYIQEG